MNRDHASDREWAVLTALLVLVLVVSFASPGCGRSEEKAVAPSESPSVRGTPIQGTASPTNVSFPLATNALSTAQMAALRGRPDAIVDGFIRPGFDKLSAFKYELHEVYSETNAGRAMLRSNDKIPPEIKAYDGRRVTVTGFLLPLRTRRGVVTEFLLLRDQGTCCFGAQAQINHFIRVSFPPGIKPGDPVPWKVSGTLRVGEMFIQGYLTGLFQMEAESAAEQVRGSGEP